MSFAPCRPEAIRAWLQELQSAVEDGDGAAVVLDDCGKVELVARAREVRKRHRRNADQNVRVRRVRCPQRDDELHRVLGRVGLTRCRAAQRLLRRDGRDAGGFGLAQGKTRSGAAQRGDASKCFSGRGFGGRVCAVSQPEHEILFVPRRPQPRQCLGPARHRRVARGGRRVVRLCRSDGDARPQFGREPGPEELRWLDAEDGVAPQRARVCRARELARVEVRDEEFRHAQLGSRRRRAQRRPQVHRSHEAHGRAASCRLAVVDRRAAEVLALGLCRPPDGPQHRGVAARLRLWRCLKTGKSAVRCNLALERTRFVAEVAGHKHVCELLADSPPPVCEFELRDCGADEAVPQRRRRPAAADAFFGRSKVDPVRHGGGVSPPLV
mmetsp:Transcript_24030/g.85787  ORF Transcript_24030/g.85787 Transcript_24030/m.85787 type:complete len:382 (-) Transcript_24030:1112-2257(-)